jgi:flavin-dependent dehydrogenase
VTRAGAPAVPADLVVVGAGPSGSSLAARLASDGAHVVLLDERSFPRSKPCGDCLSPGATPLLEELGVLEELRGDTAAGLDGWRLRAPGGAWFEGRFGRGEDGGAIRGLSLPRRQLDAALLRAAIRAGAEVRVGVRVVDLAWREGRVAGVRTRGRDGREETVVARLVAGADGLRSTVARRMGAVRRGRRPRLALVARYAHGPAGAEADGPACPGAAWPPADGSEAFGEMRISSEGCSGLAPLGGGRWNATVVVPASRAPAISAGRERFMEERLTAYGVTERLDGARRVGEIEVTGPFEVTPRRVGVPGAFLVGDAAGYFDPFTGQGIYRALATGRLGADHARAVLGARAEAEERAAVRRYARQLEELLAPSRRLQRLVDFVVARPALMDAAAALFLRRPTLADLLVRATGDVAPAGALLDPARLAAALFGRGRERAGEARPPRRSGRRAHTLERGDAHA